MDFDVLDKDDFVLSDIHIENLPITKNINSSNKSLSQIDFLLKNLTSSKEEYDEDGDLVIKRPVKNTFFIEHYLETNLDNVGLQLWKSSLYLSDYLITNSSTIFINQTQVVELGAGTGLTSLVCSLFTDKIMCTDLESIIKVAECNYKLNKDSINSLRQSLGFGLIKNEVLFKALDWSNYETIFASNCFKNLDDNDIEYLKNANLFLAADVIYDDDITIYFLNILVKLMSCSQNQPKCAYVALEKRINFEIKKLGTGSSCYDYFEQSMIELNDYCQDGIQFKAETLNEKSFPKYMINYERSEYLVIWKITTKNNNL
jgi:predicted nicotinamide N-methyase